jgi:hypothetical protein
MTAISGITPEYNILSRSRVANLLVWAVIAFLPLCIWILFKIKKKVFKFDKIIVFSALIIVGMQTAGLVSTAAATDLPQGFDEIGEYGPKFVSYEAALSLNADENILVFIVDKMDVRFLREALTDYPDVRDYLDGFTLYENNVTEFNDTLTSVVSMLTQHYYSKGQSIEDYWAEAWARHNIIDTLREHGFAAYLYLDYLSTYGHLGQISGRMDNMRETEGLRLNTGGFITTISRLSFGRISPYLLKNFFLSTVEPAFGNTLFVFNHDPLSMPLPIVSETADMQFRQYIRQNDLAADSASSVFMVMHLNGAHGGSFGDVRGNPRNIPGLVYSLDVINTYLSKIRDIGIYDNSTVIIVGDHGAPLAAEENDDDIWWVPPVTTGLLIKPKGSSGELVIDVETELSSKYFAASILELADIPHQGLSLSYFDLIGGTTPQVRVLYDFENWFGAWWNHGVAGELVFRGIYEITGDANNAENWQHFPAD